MTVSCVRAWVITVPWPVPRCWSGACCCHTSPKGALFFTPCAGLHDLMMPITHTATRGVLNEFCDVSKRAPGLTKVSQQPWFVSIPMTKWCDKKTADFLENHLCSDAESVMQQFASQTHIRAVSQCLRHELRGRPDAQRAIYICKYIFLLQFKEP